MTITTTNKPNRILAFGLPLCIFFVCYIITLTSKFNLNKALLSNAIVIDLLVTAPLIYYLAIHKTTVSKFTVIRVFVVGLLIAGWILNVHSNALLHLIHIWVSPVIELLTIFFISRKFYTANKKAKLAGNCPVDFLSYCRNIIAEVLGNEKAGNILASEIAVLYYVFPGRRNKKVDYQTSFTSYKENGILLVLGTFLCLFLIETVGMHFIFNLWSKRAAWILTALSFYTCLQLYAHIKATKARFIKLNNDSVELYNGLAGDAFVQYENIERIELTNKVPASGTILKLALIKGLENHNCIIYLKQPISATKIFGIKKETDTLLFFVDHPKDFYKNIELKMGISPQF